MTFLACRRFKHAHIYNIAKPLHDRCEAFWMDLESSPRRLPYNIFAQNRYNAWDEELKKNDLLATCS